MSALGLNRREFSFAVTAAFGGLLLSCGTTSGTVQAEPGQKPSWSANPWLRVTAAGQVIFILDRVEMGQGTMSGHTAIVAEELGLTPAEIEVEKAPVAAAYMNPVYNIQLTGGSNSTASSWKPLRLAAAAVREMLTSAGAQKLGVSAKDCRCSGGKIVHQASGRAVPFADVVALAATLPVPEAPQPLPATNLRVLGQALGRLDEEAKITGSASFGIDTMMPGLLHAAVQRPEAHGAEVLGYEAAEALAFLKDTDPQARIIAVSTGVAVVADSAWTAMQAAALIKLKTGPGAIGTFDGSMRKLAEAAGLDKPDASSKSVENIGDAEESLAQAKTKVEAGYELPYLPHVTLEPQNCTASYTGDALEIWVPTQMPVGALVMGAKISGLARSQVKVHTTYIGGGFGRRIVQDYVREAVELTVALQKPVKVIWSREQDSMHDFYRPGMYHSVRASLKDGRIHAWSHRIFGSSPTQGVIRQLMLAVLPRPLSAESEIAFLSGVMGFALEHHWTGDNASVEGADKLPYGVPNHHVTYNFLDPGVPVGFWRSVGHSHTAFVVESMVDELAVAGSLDPVALRRELLKGNPRDLAVLEQAARMSAWQEPLPQPAKGRRARGVAVHACFSSYCAQVVQVLWVDDTLHLEKVWCAVDCGFVVNPNLARQQVEGGIIFGLSAATRQEATFKDGATVQRGMNELGLLSYAESPHIEVAFLDSTDLNKSPTGLGEVAVPCVAPALAAALVAAGGKRAHKLPLQLALGRGGA